MTTKLVKFLLGKLKGTDKSIHVAFHPDKMVIHIEATKVKRETYELIVPIAEADDDFIRQNLLEQAMCAGIEMMNQKVFLKVQRPQSRGPEVGDGL